LSNKNSALYEGKRGVLSMLSMSAVAPWLRGNANGTCFRDPLPGCEDEAVEPDLFFNPIEFDGIKTRVVELLPYSKEFEFSQQR
jgi:hypothetical protein